MAKSRLVRDMHSKAGVTLTEVVLVIAVMGILSGMGVSGFQSAVANARTKDATYSMTAFMEWAANESKRLSSALCVKVDPNDSHLLVAYASSCSATAGATRLDTLILEGPVTIVSGNVCHSENIGNDNFAANGADFFPKQGLSAAPSQGFFVVKYGGRELRGAASKDAGQNSFAPFISFDDCAWTKI